MREALLQSLHRLYIISNIFQMHSLRCGWRGGATGKAFGLAINRSRVQILLEAMLRNNLGQVVQCSHLCASVTKQYNLVPAGEVTVGLAESKGSLLPGG